MKQQPYSTSNSSNQSYSSSNRPKSPLDSLFIVQTTKALYVGYVVDSAIAGMLHLEKAACLDEKMYPEIVSRDANALALAYFSEDARKKTRGYDLPIASIESTSRDPALDRMLLTYTALSSVAYRQNAGKAKIARLKKFLKTL